MNHSASAFHNSNKVWHNFILYNTPNPPIAVVPVPAAVVRPAAVVVTPGLPGVGVPCSTVVAGTAVVGTFAGVVVPDDAVVPAAAVVVAEVTE